MRAILLSAAVAALLASSAAVAAPCKDAHGKFMKCRPVPMMAKPGRCKDGHGKFAKCGMPGVHPV